jgi:hypothetical protein
MKQPGNYQKSVLKGDGDEAAALLHAETAKHDKLMHGCALQM